MPFHKAQTLLELVEWRPDHALAGARGAEARAIFERLEARPWLERLAKAEAS